MVENELEAARRKIEKLETDLEKAKTEKQESAIEIKLQTALARLEKLEAGAAKGKEEEEEEEDEDNQCPICGYELREIDTGIWLCSSCGEYFEE